MAEDYISTDPNAGLEDSGYLSTDPNAGLEAKPEGGIVSNALAGAGDVIKGFAQQFVPDLSFKNLASVAYGPINAQITGYHALKSIVDTAEQVQKAEETPAFSRERFRAGLNVVSQLGLAALGARAPKLAEIAGLEKPVTPEAMPQTPEPLVSEVAAQETQPKPVEEVIPSATEIRQEPESSIIEHPPVEEGALLAETSGSNRPVQSGEIPTETVTEPVPQPEQPTNEIQTTEEPTSIQTGEQPISESPVPTEEVQTQPELAQPKVEPPPVPTETTGIAQRYREDELGEGSVIPGVGKTPTEARDWGQDFINKGGNPYDLVNQKGPKRELWQEVGGVRAEYERLGIEKRKAEAALEANPDDPMAQMAFDNADAAQRQWSKDMQPVLTRAGDALRAVSRAYPREINSFSDFTDILYDHFGGEVELTPVKRAEIQKLVKTAKQVNGEADLARQQVTEAAVKKANGKVLPFEELKADIRSTFEQLLKDCGV